MSPRKTSKRRITTALAAVTALALLAAGCGQAEDPVGNGAVAASGCNEPTPAEDIVLVASVINTTNPYMASMIEGAEALSEELGVDLRIVDSAGSSQQQISQIQAILAEGRKVALMVNTVASADAVPIVNAVENANGCVVIWWNKPDDFEPTDVGDHFVAFQMHSGVDAGRCIGEQLAESLDGEGDIIALPGVLDSTVSQQRVAGLLDALEEYPNVSILDARPANWDQQIGFQETQTLIASHGDAIDGFWAADDAMMLGAIQAFERAGRIDEVNIVGEGLYQPTIDIMEADEANIVGNTYHRGFMAASIGLHTAFLAATGEMDVSEMSEAERNGLFEIGCVTPENYEEFLEYDADIAGWVSDLVEQGPFEMEPVPLVGAGPVEMPEIEDPRGVPAAAYGG
jgi:ribose transport system substrate-binding protein